MRRALAVVLHRAFPGQVKRVARHLNFGKAAVFRDLLHHVPVAIPGGKIHPAVHPARIVAQGVLDPAHRFHELAPVHRPQEAETADAVADGHLVGGLLLVLRLNRLLDGQARLGEPLLDPRQRQGQGGTLALQSARQLRHERARQRQVRARHVRDHQNQIFRVALGHRRHLVGPPIGQVAVGPAGRDADRDAAEILDQRQAQHDRDGPQFAQLEGGDRLVGRDEPAEIFRVHPAIAVSDDLQREVVHARLPGRGAVQQAWQFPAVTLGQVPLGGANLFFDQIKIIEQPFPGWRDPAGRRDRRHEQRADVDQGPFVLGQSGQKRVRPRSRRQLMRSRETLAVLFHLDGAEQFRAQRRLVADILLGQAVAEEARPPLEPGFAKRHGAHLQVGGLRLWSEPLPGPGA